MKVPRRPPMRLWSALLLLAPLLVALNCTLPLALGGPLPGEPPESFWWTPTPASIFNLLSDPSEAATPTPGQETPPSGFAVAATVATPDPLNAPPILYYTQAGDTLPVWV